MFKVIALLKWMKQGEIDLNDDELCTNESPDFRLNRRRDYCSLLLYREGLAAVSENVIKQLSSTLRDVPGFSVLDSRMKTHHIRQLICTASPLENVISEERCVVLE
jgi:hypothetical protein